MKLAKRTTAPVPSAPPRPRNGATANAAAPGARIMRNIRSMLAATGPGGNGITGERRERVRRGVRGEADEQAR